MLIQLPSTTIRMALQSMYPYASPGLKWRLLQLWDNASGIQWGRYAPLAPEERDSIEHNVISFTAHLAHRRPAPARAPDIASALIWLDVGAEDGLHQVRSILDAPGSGVLAGEIQSILGGLDLSPLLRLVRAGARALGAPPVLLWEDAARPGPLSPRQWTVGWQELDACMPELARCVASHLLTFLVAATIESLHSNSTESPLATLAMVMLGGAWPVVSMDCRTVYLLDIGAMVRL